MGDSQRIYSLDLNGEIHENPSGSYTISHELYGMSNDDCAEAWSDFKDAKAKLRAAGFRIVDDRAPDRDYIDWEIEVVDPTAPKKKSPDRRGRLWIQVRFHRPGESVCEVREEDDDQGQTVYPGGRMYPRPPGEKIYNHGRGP